MFEPYPDIDSIVYNKRFRNGVQKLLEQDAEWHTNNELRLINTVKQSIIPDIKHFTTDYNHAKINEFNLNKMQELSNPNNFEIHNCQLNDGTKLKKISVKNKQFEDATFLTDLVNKAQ